MPDITLLDEETQCMFRTLLAKGYHLEQVLGSREQWDVLRNTDSQCLVASEPFANALQMGVLRIQFIFAA